MSLALFRFGVCERDRQTGYELSRFSGERTFRLRVVGVCLMVVPGCLIPRRSNDIEVVHEKV